MTRSSAGSAAAAIVAAALLMGTNAVCAKDYVFATSMGPQSTTVQQGDVPFYNELKKASGGALNFKVVTGGQLGSLNTALAELRDGLVDVAFVVPVFTRKELPNVNILFNMQIFGEDAAAGSAAIDETMLLHCPECMGDFKRNNSLVLAAYNNEAYGLVCRKEIKTLADVKGLKIRTVGAGASLVKFMGGVPVNMGPPDATTALQRGGIDCVHGVLNWLKNFGYWDVAKFYLETFLGSPHALADFTISRKAWDALPLAQKKLLVDSMPKLMGALVYVSDRQGDEVVRAEAIKRGVKFGKGGKDFTDMLDRYKVEARREIAATAKQLGAKNPEQVMAAYEKSYAKWEKIMNDEVKGSQAAYEKALEREIYNKLDPAKL